jgi:hypothetical protein
MVLRRYTITVADLTSGVERRATVAIWAVFAIIAAVIVLPLFVAVATTWKANGDVQRLSARHRALEIETANYRAALETLIAAGSAQSPNQDGLAESVQPPQSATHASTAPTSGVSSPAASTPPNPVSLPDPNSPTTAAADGSVITDSPAQPAAPTPAQAVEPNAAAADRPGAPPAGAAEATRREALNEALSRLTQARVLADVAEAGALASRSYEAGVTLELEAQQLSTAGRVNEALARAVEATARFRAAEIEAGAEASAATAWERLSLGDEPATPARTLRAEGPDPLVPPASGVEDTIREVIAEYVRGLESRNLAALKRVWPSLGGTQERAIQTEFANARTVQTQFTEPQITINGDITTVTGFRMYSLVTQDGQRLSSVTRTTMTLRRNGDAWVIERVVHQQ